MDAKKITYFAISFYWVWFIEFSLNTDGYAKLNTNEPEMGTFQHETNQAVYHFSHENFVHLITKTYFPHL